eukprot:5438693-Pleurochrysis_carterae.AAC.1
MKVLTLAIEQCKDDMTGLPKMLHNKSAAEGKEGICVTSLAEEIEMLYNRPRLQLLDGSEVDCGIKCCLELAAVRGMRSCRGKAAALCSCRGKQGRQMLPDEDGVSALLDGDDLAAWRAASAILEEHCTFGSELMSYLPLLDAAHCPPHGHDFTKANWKCSP